MAKSSKTTPPPKKSGAQEGNQNALKYNTPAKRQAVFKKLLKHISDGYSKDCFPDCDWDTVEKYAEAFPLDFPPDQIKLAVRAAKRKWEAMGMNGANGKIKGFNAKAWEFNMKNRFDWREKTDNIVKNPDGTNMQRTILILPAKDELPDE